MTAALDRVDGFCATCPVTDQRSMSTMETSVAFASYCGADDVCTSDLQLLGRFQQVIDFFALFLIFLPFPLLLFASLLPSLLPSHLSSPFQSHIILI